MTYFSCANPESFVGGGSNSDIGFGLADAGKEDPNTTKSRPSSDRQRNVINMAFRWRAVDGLTLNLAW